MQGILIDSTLDFGAVSIIEVDDDDRLRSMYAWLECRAVDRVELAEGLDMWLDDEGRIVADPQINPVATALAVAMGVANQNYYGKALLLAHRGPDTVGLSDAVRDDLLDDLSNIRELLG